MIINLIKEYGISLKVFCWCAVLNVKRGETGSTRQVAASSHRRFSDNTISVSQSHSSSAQIRSQYGATPF